MHGDLWGALDFFGKPGDEEQLQAVLAGIQRATGSTSTLALPVCLCLFSFLLFLRLLHNYHMILSSSS